MVEFLISKGADVNAKTDDGKTALDIARTKDNVKNKEAINILKKRMGK